MDYIATAFLTRTPKLIRRERGPQDPIMDRRKRLPEFDPKKDGNVFLWIYNTAADIKAKQDTQRRMTDKPPRMRKL